MMKNKRYLSDGVIELRLKEVEKKFQFIPIAYRYNIYKYQSDELIGRCDYRCQNNQENYYAGNIGYMIFVQHRGHGYAYLATKLLADLAYSLGSTKVYITCSPDNIASKKTIEKLDVSFIESITVPKEHYLFAQGEKEKDIYLFNLKKHN